MENIHIILADLAHISLLCELEIKTFEETFSAHNTPEDILAYTAASFNPTQLKSELEELGSLFFLAYVNHEPAGYARLRLSAEVKDNFPGKKIVELHRIYILKKYIGKGIGKAIIDHCLSMANKKRFDILWLGVWERNENAILFYKKLGFELFGSHPFMLGKDLQTDLLMKKLLR